MLGLYQVVYAFTQTGWPCGLVVKVLACNRKVAGSIPH